MHFRPNLSNFLEEFILENDLFMTHSLVTKQSPGAVL